MAITIETEDGEAVRLPTKWCICSQCHGEGKSSAYLGAFTASEMREDPEWAEDYMAGRFDRTCERCNGTGKTESVDRGRCRKDLLALYDEDQRIRRQIRDEERAERLFCGGWREEGWR